MQVIVLVSSLQLSEESALATNIKSQNYLQIEGWRCLFPSKVYCCTGKMNAFQQADEKQAESSTGILATG